MISRPTVPGKIRSRWNDPLGVESEVGSGKGILGLRHAHPTNLTGGSGLNLANIEAKTDPSEYDNRML